MKKYLILFLIISFGCTQKSDLRISQTFTSEADVDSLIRVFSKKSDFKEYKLWYNMTDSMNKNHSELNGQDKNERAKWYYKEVKKYLKDNNRIARLNRWNKRDSSETISKIENKRRLGAILYYSYSDTSAVFELYDYQKLTKKNIALGRLCGSDFTTKKGFKFIDQVGLINYLNSIKANYDTTQVIRIMADAKKYASTITGNDVDDGNSWPEAYATLGAFNGTLSATDTAVAHGPIGNEFDEQFTPSDDGTSSKIVFMDSLSYTNGINLTNPDTTNLWSAIIAPSVASRCITFSSDTAYKFIGFVFKDASTYLVICASGGENNFLLQNKFLDGAGRSVRITVNRDSVVSNYFYMATGSGRGIEVTTGNDAFIAQNTLAGIYTVSAIDFDQGAITVLNNLVENTSSTAGDLCIRGADNTALNWEGNLYYGPSLTEFGDYATVGYSTISSWRTAIQTDDADGEQNAVEADPDLQSEATTGYITISSAAYDIAEDNLIWNDASNPSAGYYQPVAAAPPAAVSRQRLVYDQQYEDRLIIERGYFRYFKTYKTD